MPDRKLIGTKVVFKKKDEVDGTIRFKTRIVTLGYMQIPGVDYTEKFSPVACDTSIKIVLALILFYYDSHGWRARSMDVEAAFLEGKMNQPMYLKIPDILVMLGFVTKEQQEKFCISLMQSMYGNVDAALRFFIIFVQCLQNKDIGMTQSQADPCVMYMKDDKGMPQVVAAVTVDDCLLGGKPEDVTCLMEKVKKYFKISIDNNMERHLGVDYKFLRNDKNEIYLEATMEKKANDIVKFFEDVTGEDVTIYETPGIPGSVLKKNEGQTLNVEPYRTLVGKLMFYTTKVGLKQSNAVRDLSRHMESPGESHWMAMKRVVG